MWSARVEISAFLPDVVYMTYAIVPMKWIVQTYVTLSEWFDEFIIVIIKFSVLGYGICWLAWKLWGLYFFFNFSSI